jgi:uncharacterized protein (DUF1778 family)
MTIDSRPESRRTERLEARVTPEEKEFLQRAAEAAGQSLTDFMLTHLHRAAHEIELEMRVMLLSAADTRRVAEALIEPPEPTEALRRAAQRYRERRTPLVSA